MLGYSNIMTLKVQHRSEAQMKHVIRGIPPAEGCLLLFIFVYAFAPFPSQCCLEEGGWLKLQEAYDVESLVCLGLFIALPFPVYVFFVFLK